MTTTRSPAPAGDILPAAPLSGELLTAVAYAFSDATTGTMSASVGAGDHARHRATLADELGMTAEAVAWMRQVHGATVLDPDADVAAAAGQPPSCDGMVTAAVDRPLAVLVADCVPVLLASPNGIGVAHSGREGTVRDVVGATVEQLRDLSAEAPIHAVIGPAIGGCCYEVPEDLARQVDAVIPGTAGTTTWGSPSLDLVGGVTAQLRARGVTQVSRAGGCTRCDGDGRWFSHRASGDTPARAPGRQAGMIVRRSSVT